MGMPSVSLLTPHVDGKAEKDTEAHLIQSLDDQRQQGKDSWL